MSTGRVINWLRCHPDAMEIILTLTLVITLTITGCFIIAVNFRTSPACDTAECEEQCCLWTHASSLPTTQQTSPCQVRGMRCHDCTSGSRR
jgi:hypothetical protein